MYIFIYIFIHNLYISNLKIKFMTFEFHYPLSSLKSWIHLSFKNKNKPNYGRDYISE